jgi:hypothetical protein
LHQSEVWPSSYFVKFIQNHDSQKIAIWKLLAPDIREDSEVLVELAGKNLDCGKSLVVARFETEGWEVIISSLQMCSTFIILF